MTDRIWTAEEIEAVAALLADPTGRYRFNDTFAAMLRQQAARIKELEEETCRQPLLEHAETMAEALENLGGHLRGLSKQGTIGMHYSDEAYTALAAYRKWKEGQDE